MCLHPLPADPPVGHCPFTHTGRPMNISAPRATGCLLLQSFSICACYVFVKQNQIVSIILQYKSNTTPISVGPQGPQEKLWCKAADVQNLPFCHSQLPTTANWSSVDPTVGGCSTWAALQECTAVCALWCPRWASFFACQKGSAVQASRVQHHCPMASSPLPVEAAPPPHPPPCPRNAFSNEHFCSDRIFWDLMK